MEVIATKREGQKLCFEGFMYTKKMKQLTNWYGKPPNLETNKTNVALIGPLVPPHATPPPNRKKIKKPQQYIKY
jgi:hypothetical protein